MLKKKYDELSLDSSNIKTESESQSDENKSQEEKHSENTENGWKYFPNYETYSHYYKYAKKVFAVGVFFIPVLGEYEAFMLGLHLLDVAWKTAHMYRKGESWMSIAAHIGKYVLKRVSEMIIVKLRKLRTFIYC